MKEKNKNITRGFHNVSEYLSGELKGIERNAFERMLQKDHFASEAIEGLSGLTSEQLQKDISILESRIRRKTGQHKRRLIYRVAASIAVLMTISSVFLVIERNKSTQMIEVGNVGYLEITKSYPVTKVEPAPKPEKSLANKITENKVHEAIIPEKDVIETQESTISETMEQKAEVIVDVQKPETRSARSTTAEAFPAPSAILHESASSKMKPVEKENKDIVIVGYGTMKSVKGDYTPAKPMNGIDLFNLYIRRNLNLPDTLRGTDAAITAGFRVLRDGTLDSITIIKSPDPIISKKLLKLIKEGPAWHAAQKNGKPIDDDVTISVDLE